MVDSLKIGKRLQKVMEYYDLSASAFADSVAVNRSSISHILSGRNKPSLDFVMKILEAYPEVELYWLLDGKGTFPKKETPTPTPNIVQKIVIPEEEIIVKPPVKIESEIKQVIPDPQTTIPKQESKSIPILETKNTEPVISSSVHEVNSIIKETTTKISKKIDRIVIFYSDGTFSAYNPDH